MNFIFMLALLISLLASSQIQSQSRSLKDTETYRYELNGDEAKIILKCPSNKQELVIPSNITENGQTCFVTSIGSDYSNCNNYYGNLNIPDNVTEISTYAFGNCGFNGTLKLPEKLEVIEVRAFYACKFTGDLFIPDYVTEIGSYAFFN